MKTTKRLIAMAAALTLTACAAAPVFTFATPVTSGSITITTNESTHEYLAYQIFDGDLDKASDNSISFSNVVWGSGIKQTTNGIPDVVEGKTIYQALSDLEITKDGNNVFKNGENNLTSAAEVAEAMEKLDSTEADKIAKVFEKYKSATQTAKSGAFDTTNNKYTVTITDPGYYLVIDNTEKTLTTGQAYSKYMLQVAGDTSVSAKTSVPTVVKKVQDINDSANSPQLTGLQDSADYDIGDTIPYTITAKIGAGIDNFSAYSLQFVDEMSDGLTLVEDSWDIKVGTTSIKTLFTASKSTTGNTWTWATNDVMANTDVPITSETEVVLTYNVKLNENAVIGSAGNPNTVKLKYDNNPNNCGKGTPNGETPLDKNIVFTYKTVFNKVDESGNALTGADFRLEKKVNGSYVDVTELHTETGAINPIKTGNTSGSTFTFTGLDDGDYKLTEIITPSGYNTISPIEFTITADHVAVADNPSLTSLSGTGGATFNVSVPNGELNTSITNTTGSTLPTTGGTGTKVLYAIGGTILVGAGMVLVSKKRAQK